MPDPTYTLKDHTSALNKIKDIAARFDPRAPLTPVIVRSFAARLDPNGLFEQLKKSLDVVLTEKELAAMMDYFDRDKSGTVEGSEFWIAFLKVTI